MSAPVQPPSASRRGICRPSYEAIALYAPDRAPCRIDLSDNTSLWGMPPAAERALREAPVSAVTRYPSLYAPELKRALGGYIGCAPDAVVTGCGSDDVLDSAFRALAEPGDRVAFVDPGFAMIPIFARMNGLEPVAVPLRADLEVDADALLATGARIIYLCSPNNPTGTTIPEPVVARVVERAPGVVILDEAYAEFAGRSLAGMAAGPDVGDTMRPVAGEEESRGVAAPARGSLLVVRTMSKAFGLAGLRIGYAVGAPALVAEVEKSRGPYKVSALAERCALAALGEGRPWVRDRIADALEARARLEAGLRALGLEPIPSAANFVLVPVPDAGALAGELRARGVAVRPFERLTNVGDALRISVGPWPLLEEALDVLRGVLA